MAALQYSSNDRRKHLRSPYEDQPVGNKTIFVPLVQWSRPAIGLKRMADIALSLVALVLLTPVMAIIALIVRVTSDGGVFFAQERLGRGGKPFRMYKFRTMIANAEVQKSQLLDQNEASGPVFKMRLDPRVTPVGKILRKYSLDELPQFWNVLHGEMSLVGPRPALMQEVRKYRQWQLRRLSTKPGITCIWQVSGRSRVGFEDWMRMDIRYIENWKVMLDAKLLAKTIRAVIKSDGAY